MWVMGRLSAAAILLADRLASNSAASSRPTGEVGHTPDIALLKRHFEGQ